MCNAPAPAGGRSFLLCKHKRHDLFDATFEAAAVRNPVHVALKRSPGVFANAQQTHSVCVRAHLLKRFDARRTG